MIICGLDLSMNGSGLVKLELDDDLNVVNTDRMGFCSVKKHSNDTDIHLFKKKDYVHRYHSSVWMIDKIKKFVADADFVAVEDYAFGANGNVFDIGEFIGQVKLEIFNMNIPIRLYDPNSIKKHASGKGNCDKITMYDSYVSFAGMKPDLSDVPEPVRGSGISPTSDIVDAFYIATLLQLELQLRKGIIALRDITDDDRSIFNRVTKARPVNLLDSDFIKK